MAADGSYTYDPNSIPSVENLSLGDHTDTFSYTAADGHGDTSTSTLTITVNSDAGDGDGGCRHRRRCEDDDADDHAATFWRTTPMARTINRRCM